MRCTPNSLHRRTLPEVTEPLNPLRVPVWPEDLTESVHAELEARRFSRRLKAQAGAHITDEHLVQLQGLDRIPSLASLRVGLDVSYRATLTVDEGRPTTFRLAYVEQALAIESGWPALALSEPIELDVNALRRIAPTAGSGQTVIAIDDVDGPLHIWGLIRLKQPEVGESRLPAVIIHGSAPGHLTVTSSNSEVLVVGPSQTVLLRDERPSGFTYLGLISSALAMQGPASPEPSIILQVALALRSHGHGGTLLVAASHRSGEHNTSLTYPTHTDTQRILPTALDECIEFSDLDTRITGLGGFEAVFASEQRSQAQRSLREAVAFVAGLSAVDGAVLMASDLRVLGFGAFIDTKGAGTSAITVIDGLNPGNHRTIDRTAVGGARHQSALAFVEQYNGDAIAFVASQDGVLSLILGAADGALAVMRPVLPDLR